MPETKKNNPLTFIAQVFTIALPLLYLLGFAYQVGYLSIYGIDNGLFPKSIPDYLTTCLFFLLNAFGMSVNYYILAITATAVCGTLLLMFISFIILISNLPISKLKQYLSKYEPHFFKIQTKISSLYFKSLKLPATFFIAVLATLYSILFIMVFVSIITITPYRYGQYVAKEQIRTAEICSINERQTENCTALLQNGKVVATGKIVATSDTYIALYNTNKTSIYLSKDYQINIFLPVKKFKSSNKAKLS